MSTEVLGCGLTVKVLTSPISCVCVSVGVFVRLCVFTKVLIRGLVYDITMVSEDVSETEDVNTGPRIQFTLK